MLLYNLNFILVVTPLFHEFTFNECIAQLSEYDKVQTPFSCLFFKIFLEDRSLFVGPLVTLFWTSGDIYSGFQSQSGQPYSHLAEVYVIYVPRDSPLVQHLPTSW